MWLGVGIDLWPVVSEEAENERMHLMVGMSLKKPSFLFRNFVSIAQGKPI